MKLSDFVDQIGDCLDNDLRSFGLYDDYEYYYDKRGGVPYLIIDSLQAHTRHGMEMKSAFKQFELLECSIEDIYIATVRVPLLTRIMEIEKSLGHTHPGFEEKSIPSDYDEIEAEEQLAYVRDNR